MEFAEIAENTDVLFFLISNYNSCGLLLPPCCCTNLFLAGDMRMNIQGMVNGDKQVWFSHTHPSSQTRALLVVTHSPPPSPHPHPHPHPHAQLTLTHTLLTRTRTLTFTLALTLTLTHTHTHPHTHPHIHTYYNPQTFARFDMASLSFVDRCCSNGIVVGALRKTPPGETDSNGWEFVAIGDTYTQCGLCCMCANNAKELSDSVLSKHSWVSDKAARGANSFPPLPPPPPSDQV